MEPRTEPGRAGQRRRPDGRRESRLDVGAPEGEPVVRGGRARVAFGPVQSRPAALLRGAGRRAACVGLCACCAAWLAGAARSLTPPDPDGQHPAYAALGLPAAWDLTTGRPEVVVAVIDSGVDPTHPDLAGAVGPGWDFVEADADPLDPPGNGHGTAVAGVLAARAGNGLGGAGVCFACTLMPLRVIGLDGIALNTNTAAAIDYAVDHGAAVVNASIYSDRSPQRLRDAVVRARAAGVLVVAAAGNEGNDRPGYPAAFPEALSVASAASPERLATFSSFGDWVKFAAPDCAPITTLDGGSGVACATSVSAPLVAGVVALLRARAPYASAAAIEAALAATSRPVLGTRHGLVDAAAALTWLGSPPPTLTPVILGTPAVGQELEALSGVWPGSGLAVTLQWLRCRSGCTPIPGATTPRYVATGSDAGHALRVEASAPGAEVVVSAATAAVAARPRSLQRPSVAGVPRVGSTLVARTGTWAGTSLVLATRWLRCRGGLCTQVAETRRYRVRAGDRGYRLRLDVLASNLLGNASARSRPTPVVR